MAALRRVAEARKGPLILVSTPDAVLQRLPPASVLKRAQTLKPGAKLDAAGFERALLAAGYVRDERVDEAGEFALRGQVLEVFPAAGETPVRIDLDDATVQALRPYDPVSQRALGEIDQVVLDPASEAVLDDPEVRWPGMEHWLPQHYEDLDTVFDRLGAFEILLEPKARARAEAAFSTVEDAFRERQRWFDRQGDEARKPLPPDRLYLTREEWSGRVEQAVDTAELVAEAEAGPVFATGDNPTAELSAHLRQAKAEGLRIVVSAAAERDRTALKRRVQRALGEAVGSVKTFNEALKAEGPVALSCPADRGFLDRRAKVVLIAATDVLGSRAAAVRAKAAVNPLEQAEAFSIDDVVVHLDHGVGVVRGLQAAPEGAGPELIEIEYAKGARLLAPVSDLMKVWRYGSEAEAVSLDRLDTGAWLKRRAKIEEEIGATALGLLRMADARRNAAAPKITPPRGEFETFAAGFRYPLTSDQAAAVDATLADLEAGRPMDRLVVGDVGYGKTEVALRAAAAVALAGGQVAIAAPTTVLVRQHLETFRRRFEGLGVTVESLSRVSTPAELKRVKAELQSGEIRVVVGTHALAGENVSFSDLGLVIIDEEQKFGTADKRKLRELADGAHVLALTATPIPRTLQAAMVGLQDLSVIATPPARRRPVRTFVTAFDPGTVRAALLREKARGGQSFFVAPRIEDLDGLKAQLAELVPDLDVVIAHGKMPAEAVDETMVAFADGRGDVLLATNIIESGLDVPAANTMLVWRSDLFGVAQLHQLRGRVGRGRAQGICYLLSEGESPATEAAAKRLGALAANDRLGAGLAISLRDLDLRGAGDLLGEEQAGHLKLIGPGLYQHLLALALRAAQGETVQDWTPHLNIDAAGAVPEDYVPEPELRLNLYARLIGAEDATALDRLAEEMEDRFGAPPPPVRALLGLERLRREAKRLGVVRIDAGPQAVALTFRANAPTRAAAERLTEEEPATTWKGERLVFAWPSDTPDGRLEHAAAALEALT
jgi:transcription-repair coupling factor (superfamily II helicase)